jgi:hypothetical protein
LYLLIPATSDHLYNLEHEPQVVLTTDHWQLRGSVKTTGQVQPAGTNLAAINHPHTDVVVEVTPVRMHVEPTGKGSHRQTIDFQ